MHRRNDNIFYIQRKELSSVDEIGLVHSGADFFDTLEEIINTAQYILHFQTYIFEGDATGKRIANALIAAAKKGVKVFLVVDGFGSKNLSRELIAELINAGVHFRFFSPFFSTQNIYIGRRLHHKIVVADATVALIGGINIADKYKGTSSNAPWLDYAVLVKGDVCEQAHKICEQIWEKQFRSKFRLKKSIPHKINADNLVNFRQNDRLRNKSQICYGYARSIHNSKKSVTIVASYFLPGRSMRESLEIAAKKGVKIKIILSGISDIPLFRLATSYLYSYLHKHNIEIFEWQKSMLHGKMAVVDSRWTTIGSYNLNYLSAFGSIELNVEILNNDFAKSVEKHLSEIIKDGCIKIEGENLSNWKIRIVGAIAYLLVRTGIKFLALFPNMKYLYTKMND